MKFKKIIAAILCGFLLFSCSTTSEFDGNAYLKSLLDLQYKADFESYTIYTDGTYDEALEYYLAGIEYETNIFAQYLSIELNDNTYNRTMELYKQIYSHSNYTITTVSKTKDKQILEVTVKPIMIFEDSLDAINEYYDSFSEMYLDVEEQISFEELIDIYANGILDILFNNLNSIRLGDPVTITVQVFLDEEVDAWNISDLDYMNIDELIIAY